MRCKQHIRKQLNLNSHICKRYRSKMLVETESKITSKVLLCDEFTKGENSLIQKSGIPQELGTDELYKGEDRAMFQEWVI